MGSEREVSPASLSEVGVATYPVSSTSFSRFSFSSSGGESVRAIFLSSSAASPLSARSSSSFFHELLSLIHIFINYYQEENQDIDTVLDIFIRTNSGGEPLSFSNLLMSITTANWKKDARKEFKVLIDTIYENNFIISAELDVYKRQDIVCSIVTNTLSVAVQI